MDERNHELTQSNSAAPKPHKTAAMGEHQSHLDRRTQRLEDLTVDALEEPNALRATVKVATAQLLDIGIRLGDEIKANIVAGQTKPKSRQDRPGEINTLMLVHRQITRYVQLDQQWASEKPRDRKNGEGSAEADEVD